MILAATSSSDSIVAIISAISAATVAIITALAAMNSNRKKQLADNKQQLQEIHVLVNSRLTATLEQIEILQKKLDEHSISYDEFNLT